MILPAQVVNGRMLIELITTDATGCQTILKQMVEVTPVEVRICPLDLDLQIELFPGSEVPPFSTVQFLFTDTNGIQYQSDLIEQPEISIIEVLQAEDYLPNPEGDPTKKLELNVHCLLYNLEGFQPLQFQSSAYTIGLAYPE